MVIPATYHAAMPFCANGLAAVKKSGRWGFIDKSGTEVIPCTFEDTLGFEEGNLAPVKKNALWGYVSKDGELIVPPLLQRGEKLFRLRPCRRACG